MAGLIGKTLRGFKILEQIQDDESAQGTVCKAVCIAEDPGLAVAKGQIVALKVMPVRDENRQQWTVLENRTRELAQLDHPNIVRYFGCFCEQGEWNQLYVIVQEFLEGETLKERLRRFPAGLDVDEGLKIVDQALAGLSHTASKGIVHRDVKPGNIFICEKDDGVRKELSVKLIDFEIAKQGRGSTTASTGNLRGSFNYMAPEFLDAGFRGDQQSDVFSMGVTLHETLTGKLPYETIGGRGEDAILDFVARWKNLAAGQSPVFISSNIKLLLAHADEMLQMSLSPIREQRFKTFEDFRASIKSVRFRSLANPENGNAYQILQYIGKGGFGEVYKARESKTRRIVAIKHLRKARQSDRFKREARILAQFSDSCFVRFVESFSREMDGKVQEFLVMGFLDGMPGSSLQEAIERSGGSGLPIKDVLTAFVRYAHGLRVLHNAGVFHRDIKPANLYFPVGCPDRAVIMDFGIARNVNGTVTYDKAPGTPDYMAPEVVKVESRGESGTDIYSLGLCLYEALTAKSAFPRLPAGMEAFKKLVERVNSKAQPRFDDERIDADVFDFLTDMTAYNPAYRIRDAEEVERRLREFLQKLGSPSNVDPIPCVQPGSVRRKGTLKWVIVAVSCVVGITLLVGAGLFAFPWAKKTWAKQRLVSVLEAHRRQDPDAERMETEWIVEFNPQSYSWLRLDVAVFTKCTNDLRIARQQAVEERFRDEWLARIGRCMGNDGGLKVDEFVKLGERVFPKELCDDAGIAGELSELGDAVRAAVTSRTAIGDVTTRRRRLGEAVRVLESPWTATLLGNDEISRMRSVVQDAGKMCVGRVHNGCGDEIEVCGVRIAANETRTVLVRDGHPERQVVTRHGYDPVRLPSGFDGAIFSAENAMFVERPIAVSIPALAAGHRFILQGREYVGGESVELKPGRYVGKYVRDDKTPTGIVVYEDCPVEFSVAVNADVKIPAPRDWTHTDQYRRYLSAPVDVAGFDLEAGVTLRVDDNVIAGADIKMMPGKHVCVYEKDDYLPQTNVVEVLPGKAVALPRRRVWKPTQDLERMQEAERLARQKSWPDVAKLISSIKVVSPENCSRLDSLKSRVSEWKLDEAKRREAEKRRVAEQRIAERKAIQDDFEQCLADEPIKGRRKRLEKARAYLQNDRVKHLIDEEMLREWGDRVAEREHWVVGKVRNDCDFQIRVGIDDLVVNPGESRLVRYDDRQSLDVVLTARGYDDRRIAREILDEKEVVINRGSWIFSDVVVNVAGAREQCVCEFAGERVEGAFRVKPGRYVLVFKRDGYESQNVSFEARICAGCTVSVPDKWRPLPIEARVQELKDGGRCYLGDEVVSKSVRLIPGQTYEFRYAKDDCEDQFVRVVAEVGVPLVLPLPSAWVEVKDVDRLSRAELSAKNGKWDEASREVEGIVLRSPRNLERLRILREKIEKAVALKESIGLAQVAYWQEDWQECVRRYFGAYESGYSLSPDDFGQLDRAYKNGIKELKQLHEKVKHDIGIGRSPIRDLEAIKKDMRQLNVWYAAIRK